MGAGRGVIWLHWPNFVNNSFVKFLSAVKSPSMVKYLLGCIDRRFRSRCVNDGDREK